MALRVSSLFDFAGKVAVVTGGGRGIGRMISDTFVSNGIKVYITSRSAEACEKAAKEMTSMGPGECIALPHDLTASEGLKEFVEELSSREKSLNILVNNSGTTWGEPMETYPDKAWDRCFNLNVRTVFNLTRACLPLLDKGSQEDDPGRVINIGSIAGLRAQPVPTFAYDASKAAVHMLTQKLSSELANRSAHGGHRITVNAVAPGFVPSKMSSQLLSYAEKEEIERAIPLGRMGRPEDMGGVCLYLSSKAATWVTGAVIPVDGGTTAAPLTMVSKL